VRQANAGVSAARNAGIRCASGALVAFLDSDDGWTPDKLEREVAVLAAHPEVDALFADLDKHHGDVYVPSFARGCPPFAALLARHRGEETIVFTPREMLLCLLQEVPIMPSAFTMRRDALLRLGGFDTAWRSWEDWELFLRYASAGGRFAYIDRPLATLRISSDSLHIADSIGGQTTMLAFLRRQRARLRGDAEARAALRRGLQRLRRRMGWHHLHHRRRRAACANYLRGFVELGDVGMLLRAGAALVPGMTRRASAGSRG
jgi:glycosyltransferase involved in cell wall biosynthesis